MSSSNDSWLFLQLFVLLHYSLSAAVNISASNDTKIRIILLQLLSWYNGGATPNFATLSSQASSINPSYGTPSIADTTDLPDL